MVKKQEIKTKYHNIKWNNKRSMKIYNELSNLVKLGNDFKYSVEHEEYLLLKYQEMQNGVIVTYYKKDSDPKKQINHLFFRKNNANV